MVFDPKDFEDIPTLLNIFPTQTDTPKQPPVETSSDYSEAMLHAFLSVADTAAEALRMVKDQQSYSQPDFSYQAPPSIKAPNIQYKHSIDPLSSQRGQMQVGRNAVNKIADTRNNSSSSFARTNVPKGVPGSFTRQPMFEGGVVVTPNPLDSTISHVTSIDYRYADGDKNQSSYTPLVTEDPYQIQRNLSYAQQPKTYQQAQREYEAAQAAEYEKQRYRAQLIAERQAWMDGVMRRARERELKKVRPVQKQSVSKMTQQNFYEWLRKLSDKSEARMREIQQEKEAAKRNSILSPEDAYEAIQAGHFEQVKERKMSEYYTWGDALQHSSALSIATRQNLKNAVLLAMKLDQLSAHMGSKVPVHNWLRNSGSPFRHPTGRAMDVEGTMQYKAHVLLAATDMGWTTGIGFAFPDSGCNDLHLDVTGLYTWGYSLVNGECKAVNKPYTIEQMRSYAKSLL